MHLYIAGPSTHYPDGNRPSFFHAETVLRVAGHDAVNPARYKGHHDEADNLRVDIAEILTAEGVAVLPDWQTDRKSALEVQIAHVLGLPVLPLEVWAITPPAATRSITVPPGVDPQAWAAARAAVADGTLRRGDSLTLAPADRREELT